MNGVSTRPFRDSDVMDFIRRNDRRGHCFGRWPDNILQPFIRFSNEIGSAYLVTKNDELVGVGFARQVDEDDLDRHWVPQKRSGTVIEFQDVLCEDREGLEALANEFDQRNPMWREKELYATRHGRRKRIKPEVIERILA